MHQQVNSNTILFPLKLHVRYGITIHQWEEQFTERESFDPSL